MTQTVTGAVTAAIRELVDDSDLRMIGLTIGGVYLIATVLAVAAGYDVGGIVNTLRAITVFAAGYGMLVLALNLHWGYTGLFNIGGGDRGGAHGAAGAEDAGGLSGDRHRRTQ
jgi:hypothetical protein